MSPELKELLSGELGQLDELLSSNADLFKQLRLGNPSLTEIEACAAVLHSFYTGIESLFKTIATRVDGSFHKSEDWHAALLSSMKESSPKRPAAISSELYLTLKEYLKFRHVFRQGYSFKLSWQKMEALALGMHDCLKKLRDDLSVLG